ncbi:MAG: DUF3276 family protein [Bacteroidales bacterium]|nr:DUF3276 family protein [Bacteroidales bacterium]
MTTNSQTSVPMPHGDTLHTIRMRAGKRTYYFDVKRDRKGGCYLTITEARSRNSPDGTPAGIEKQKLFVYAEDMYNFMQAINEAFAMMAQPAKDTPDDAFEELSTDAPLANINIALGEIDF